MMKDFKLQSNEYQLVFFLSDLGFPTSNNLFGQLTIVIDLCRLIKKNIDVYILTTNKNNKVYLDKNIHILNINDPFVDHLAYKSKLEAILKNKKTTIATSMMIHRDCEALYKAAKLKKIYPNLKILVGLYCTANEYFYKILPIPKFPRQARKYIKVKNIYTLTMKKYLKLMAKENLIDRYLVPNQYTKNTYLDKKLDNVILPTKICVVESGSDETLFKPISLRKKASIKRKHLTNSNEFTVCFGTRFTQYKGADILEEVLSYYNSSKESPTFLFPLYPNLDTIVLSKVILQYKYLLKNRKIKFFLDLYRQKTLFGKQWLPYYKKSTSLLEKFISSLEEKPQKYIEKSFLGVLDFPIYHLIDLMLRPSIADSQGIALFESSLCNCPTVGTNRVGFYHDVKELTNYAVKLSKNIQIYNRYASYKTPQYVKEVRSAATRFIHIIESEMKKFKKEIKPFNSRRLIIKNNFTSKEMLKRHIKLYKNLNQK